MLSELKVQNFAIIDNLTVEFNNGFTTLTGETGAGKSLIIDAIGLLFGDRSSVLMIRSGESKAMVEGVFEDVSEYTKAVLDDLSIELLDGDVVVIKRELSVNGKNLIRVNGEIITLNQLEKLASTLGDIHTQNDTHKLFTENNYLTFIDNTMIGDTLKEYQLKRNEYLKALEEYNHLIDLSNSDLTNVEYWNYQYNELLNAKLNINEENNLNEELSYLNNFESIFKLLSQIINDINDNNIVDGLYDIINSSQKLSKYMPDFNKDLEMLNDCYYSLDDFANRIKNKMSNLDFDNERLNEINERLSFLDTLKHKYHKSVSEMLSYMSELKQKIDSVEQMDDLIAHAKKEVSIKYQSLCDVALKLTNERKESAKLLEDNVLNTLNDLMLSKVKFKYDFKEYTFDDEYNSSLFKPNGCDVVDIKISFNVGEGLKSLSKVASGGEMSRIMLALKVHTLKTLKLSTVIFDEIDSGISGSVAGKVAEKLKEISRDVQVLAITHLPIVASYADHQYHIWKSFSDNNTFTQIEKLDFNRRIDVLSEMISPNESSPKAKELALSMLEHNNMKKSGR